MWSLLCWSCLASAQVILAPLEATGFPPQAPFSLNPNGTAVVIHQNKAFRVPLEEGMPSKGLQGSGAYSLPKNPSDEGDIRFAGDFVYWRNQFVIHRRRLEQTDTARWMELPYPAQDWLPLTEDRILLLVPRHPPGKQGTEGPIFLEVWTDSGRRPVAQIPFPEPFNRLNRAGLRLLPECLVRNLGHWVFILHAQTGLAFALDTRSLALRELEVPWHTLTVKDVASMKQQLGRAQGTLKRFNGDAAHTDLRMAPLDSHTIRLWSMWVPAAKPVQLKASVNGKEMGLPPLWSPHAEMSVDTWNREVGLRIYDLVMEAEALSIQQVGHIKGDDPRLNTRLRPGAIPNPDGSWTSLDLWLKRRLPPEPKPSPTTKPRAS